MAARCWRTPKVKRGWLHRQSTQRYRPQAASPGLARPCPCCITPPPSPPSQRPGRLVICIYKTILTLLPKPDQLVGLCEGDSTSYICVYIYTLVRFPVLRRLARTFTICVPVWPRPYSPPFVCFMTFFSIFFNGLRERVHYDLLSFFLTTL
ncbi:hypothetical protein GGS23DRAFT_271224 [Durotheca rogersii]|uniref:uncharacterized protein n=1 Tax=Durotheca rogersii TaxID=419775 RepID=UPI00221EA50E|nr:uncharacterized protein GGS23DRAFT_271224 [Durotheca rogersii]KAI5866431.1 hypothetical protein GGS23DRAFT_271224 [Durotheca rogersii]